jgi:Ca-activated chloride channel homolog
MKVRFVRSALTSALVLATFLTGFPPALAVSSLNSSPQSGDTGRPRRGKNGSSVKRAAPGQPAGRKDNTPSKDAPAPGDLDPADDFDRQPDIDATADATQDQSRKEDAKTQPTGSPSNASGQAQKTPPPFDRPPLDPSQRPQAGPTSNPEPRATSPARDNSRATPAGDGQPNSSPDPNSRRQEPSEQRTPVLRRPNSEGDPQQEQPEKKKPVLRRSSDPRDDGPGSQPRVDPRAGQSNDDVAAPQSEDGETIKLDATLVNIPVLVSDRSGRYVPQLSEQDFLLYEDGTQQQVAFFTNEEVAFNVALVLDMSPSTADNHKEIQDAALAFVRQLRPQDRVMVVAFDRSVSYLTDFTNNRRELESAIRSTYTGSGTSVYDAVFETITRRMESLEGRKAMILFSDGEDTTSNRASFDEAINVVSESDVLVYGLRYPGGANVQVNPWPRNRNPFPDLRLPFPFPWPRRRRGNFTNFDPSTQNGGANYAAPPQRNRRQNGDFMEAIATAGGGPVYDAEQISDLSRLATKIADELRHVYVISYYPTNPLTNGGRRSIQIRIKGRSDIAVRHRRGYNAREVQRASGT